MIRKVLAPIYVTHPLNRWIWELLSFDAEDLGALSTLIQQASEFIASRRVERGE